MTMNDDTATRLARLEGKYKRLQSFAIVGALVLVGLTLGVVECFRERSDLEKYGLPTTKFTLLDDQGTYLSSLGTYEDRRPYFKFLDHSGTVRMFFALEADGPMLKLNDTSGRPRVRLSAQDAGGKLELLDADGGTRWSAP